MNILMTCVLIVCALVPAPRKPTLPANCPPFPLQDGQYAPMSYAPPSSYANTVVGAKDVIDPQYALGMEDINMAYMTATSVLTLSFPAVFYSGIAVPVIHAVESTCDYLWMYVTHYADLTQPPLATTTSYAGLLPGEWGIVGEGYSLNIPFHRYVVLTFNTDVYVDAVYYLIRPNRYWLPVIAKASAP